MVGDEVGRRRRCGGYELVGERVGLRTRTGSEPDRSVFGSYRRRRGLRNGDGRTQDFSALRRDVERPTPVLPDGYDIERDADVLTLLRADGSVVARFSARGVELQEVERLAAQDAAGASHKRLRRPAPAG